MRNKTIMSIILGVCIAVLNIFIMTESCLANIPKSELSLGGVTGWSVKKDVMRIYGKPTREEYAGHLWHYGDSVSIRYDEGTVSSVIVTANNGWATPAGLIVGMDVNTAVKLYGDPDKSKTQGNKTLYVYFVNYLKGGDGHLGIVFDKSSNKITKLAIKKSHMVDFKEYYSGWEDSMLK